MQRARASTARTQARRLVDAPPASVRRPISAMVARMSRCGSTPRRPVAFLVRAMARCEHGGARSLEKR